MINRTLVLLSTTGRGAVHERVRRSIALTQNSPSCQQHMQTDLRSTCTGGSQIDAPLCDAGPSLRRHRQATACWPLRRSRPPARTSGSRRSRPRMRGLPSCPPLHPPPAVLRQRRQQPLSLSLQRLASRQGAAACSLAVPGLATTCYAASQLASLAILAASRRTVRSIPGTEVAAGDRACRVPASGAAPPAWRGSVAADALGCCLVHSKEVVRAA